MVLTQLLSSLITCFTLLNFGSASLKITGTVLRIIQVGGFWASWSSRRTGRATPRRGVK